MQKTTTLRSGLISFIFSLFCFSGVGQQLSCQAGKSSQAPPIYPNSENLKSDTFNILKYTINLEVGNATNKLISGHTIVRLAPKMNGRNFIRLDLLKLTVDSVKENSQVLTYSYNDTVLKINFATTKNITDTSSITVYYKGVPQIDASQWGGFYFDNNLSNQYAYNLGVGFAANPHNYGRVWFPCFDNFIERSKYEFNITTDTLRKAYCNGQLISDVISNQKRTRKWVLNEEIPTYLASVSLAKYAEVNWTVNTLTGVKPITLVGVPADTAAMKAGFVNLKSCIQGFENYFGPYKWNRVGYCLVPFNSGAMEHATNITYPRSATSVAFEELMYHELSHHWWGNLITCETPEDMWINEGFASFSAFMFFEWQYGKANYLNRVKNQHDNLLHFLHWNEGGFKPVSGLPHSLTYSDHVYKKGADIAHTLRGYMGDSAFFAGIKYTMQQKSYQSINSIEFRDLMQTGSGQNLVDYFNNWVFNGGWSHFSVDSVNYIQNATNVQAVISVKQKLYGAPTLHSNVPLEISFFDAGWGRVIRKVVMSGAHQTFTVTIPSMPVYHALNYDSKINDASSHDYRTIKNTGIINLPLSKALITVTNPGSDSSLVRIIHNYVKPDGFKNQSTHKISNQHYWKVEGIFSPGFVSKCQFNYNGYKGTSGTNIYLDTLLAQVNGDSIALFYRSDTKQDWTWLKKAVKTKSNLKSGYFVIDTLKTGEYAFGNLGDTSLVGIQEVPLNNVPVKVFPNPAKQSLNIEFKTLPATTYLLHITNIEGREVFSKPANKQLNTFDVSQLARGTYTVSIRQPEGTLIHSQKIVLE